MSKKNFLHSTLNSYCFSSYSRFFQSIRKKMLWESFERISFSTFFSTRKRKVSDRARLVLVCLPLYEGGREKKFLICKDREKVSPTPSYLTLRSCRDADKLSPRAACWYYKQWQYQKYKIWKHRSIHENVMKNSFWCILAFSIYTHSIESIFPLFLVS